MEIKGLLNLQPNKIPLRKKKNIANGQDKVKVSKASIKRAGRLFSYLQPQLGFFWLGLVFLLLSSLASMVFPYLTGQLVDAAQSDFLNKIDEIAFALLLVFFLNAIFSFFRIYLFAIVTQRSLAKLRQKTYAHLLSLQMRFFDSRRIGELTSRISSDIALLQETLTTTIAEFIRQIIIIIVGTILLSFISGKLTLFMLALIPVVVIVAVFFGRFIKKLSTQAQDKVASSNVIVEETLQGISSVKAFVNESFEYLRYKKLTDDVIDISLKGAKWRGAFASFLIFCLFGSIIAVIWYGAILIQSNELSIGDLFTFILYSVFVGASIGGIADHYAQIQKAIGATEHLLDLLEEEPEQANNDSTKRINQGSLAFNNVHFSYPNREDIEVLKGLSFSAEPGQTIAIVGPSGAGKSTITSLILKFYTPKKGNILIDGFPIDEFALNHLRKSIALVPQEVLLFGGSIYENILYGNPEASKQEIIEAARQANALEFIDSFPEKMETLVGERGVQLSGGQRQRIAIARAILKNPKILILDEATSSLDSKSEQLVQDALEKLMEGRTSIVIAHRLSTIQNADNIIVLKEGMLEEQGKHDELNKKDGGLYQELKKLQV